MYQAGIYCRISIEEQNKEGEYSNSIHSQIQMARDYIAENKDIAEKKVYVDDGASGSNFERTEFRRMLADIELGVINMVIFKDVSRLGREHIDTNYYLGKYFPEKQIRIVSILDNYDSAVGTYDEMLEIKTLLNDMYLRDTSRKIKTTIQTKRSMGEYTPKQPPFGYVKSKTIHNHLEIDPYAAEVVRRIYRMYQNGFGCTVICRTLNEDEIPCPAKYKKEVLKTNYVWDSGKGLWTSSKELFEEEPSIDSLVCATDTMAVGAMTYLKEIGLRIPEDVQIAGIGDGVPGKIVEPKLTTVHFYYKTSGMEAAAMLADLIENDTGISKEIKMGCELVERESHR